MLFGGSKKRSAPGSGGGGGAGGGAGAGAGARVGDDDGAGSVASYMSGDGHGDDGDVSPSYASVLRSVKQGVHEVAVAFVAPRARTGQKDGKKWTIGYYQFLDNEQYSHLESVLIQLQCHTCYVNKLNASTADAHKVRTLLECTGVRGVDVARSAFASSDIEQDLRRLLGDAVPSFLVDNASKKLAMNAIACLVSQRKLLGSPDNLGACVLEPRQMSEFMALDAAAVRALNLLPDPRDPTRLGSLHQVLAAGCLTKGGARLLRKWVVQPLMQVDSIRARQACVEALVDDNALRDGLACLKSTPDVERIAARLQRKSASLGDIVSVVFFAQRVPDITAILRAYKGRHAAKLEVKFAAELERITAEFQPLIDMAHEIIDMDRAQRGEFVINPSWDDNLEELAQQRTEVEQAIMAEFERAQSLASTMDIKCENDARRGVVMRTARSNDKKLRKLMGFNVVAVLKDGVRFTTSKMSALGKQLQDLADQYDEAQVELVAKAVEIARTYLPVIEASGALMSELDAYMGMAGAVGSAPADYVKPSLLPAGEGDTVLREARHPVLERMDDMTFIPNDYELKRESGRFHIITGPNMGGKSTYIRQLGTLAVMAQMGAFVPATEATFSIVDAVLARVGAGDLQVRGISTFMAEMLEASSILKTATNKSLVIIDELGRGTSTFDGFGLAWAISEHLAGTTKCFCMFATHFHELTALQSVVKGVVNRHVTAHTTADSITMLFEVKDGACPSSFGIHVAELAAFPPSVVKEARLKAAQLERFSSHGRALITAAASEPASSAAAEGPHASKRQRTVAPSGQQQAILKFLQEFAAMPVPDMPSQQAIAQLRTALGKLPPAVVSDAMEGASAATN